MADETTSLVGERDSFKVVYQHETLKGISYEVGQQQGEHLKRTNRCLVSYEPPEPEVFALEMRRLYDEYCPGLTQEVQGLADADLRLCTTQIDGKFSHIGFSDMCVGRLDGFNQHGLSVTLSYAWEGIPEDLRETHGLHYAIAVRAALEHCRFVDEAVDLWQRMLIGNNGLMLVADPSGNAACMEIAGHKRAVDRIGPDSGAQFMVYTNHYILIDFPGHAGYVPSSHSVGRRDRFTAWLKENQGQITIEGLEAFLDRDWATGVSSYNPEYRAGTLWSMVLDVTAGKVEVRFGPPPGNPWHPFTMDGKIGLSEYTVAFPL